MKSFYDAIRIDISLLNLNDKVVPLKIVLSERSGEYTIDDNQGVSGQNFSNTSAHPSNSTPSRVA